MAEEPISGDDDLPAGDFGTWIVDVQAAIRGARASDVPCDGCTACCTASQFIHIAPDETETLARIPAPLLFPRRFDPRGHVLLGYDEHGHCPMLVDHECTIYEHRPRTCRTYDCRVFPAAGLEPDGDEKVLIAQRARRWRFGFGSAADRTRRDAVRAAAAYVREHRAELATDSLPTNATQHAVLAIEIHERFLQRDSGEARVIEPPVDEIRVELTRRRRDGS